MDQNSKFFKHWVLVICVAVVFVLMFCLSLLTSKLRSGNGLTVRLWSRVIFLRYYKFASCLCSGFFESLQLKCLVIRIIIRQKHTNCDVIRLTCIVNVWCWLMLIRSLYIWGFSNFQDEGTNIYLLITKVINFSRCWALNSRLYE